MTKAELRREYLAKRRALPEGMAEGESHRMRKPLMHLLCYDGPKHWNKPREFVRSAFVHTFLPIEDKREIDTWYFIKQAWSGYKSMKIAASVADPIEKILTHYRIRPDTVFIRNQWGIPEPQPTGGRVLPAKFDVVLVPLLAFDRHGHRVGYGGGYYDRFLAECRPDCIKVGLSLFDPVERIDDVEPTDIKLDACLTAEGAYFF